MKLRTLIVLLFFALFAFLGCSDREYEYPSGYRVTLFLMGGKFSDNTSDRVHGGIMLPTALKDVPGLVHGDPYLTYDQPFAAWNTDRYGYGEDYTAESIIDKSLTLYAIYGRYIYDEYSLRMVECDNPNAVYVLSDNITISNPWNPLCPLPKQPFRGKLYGQGYTISFTTRSGGSAPDSSGLFAYTNKASVAELKITANVTGSSYAGAVAGFAENSLINKVRVSGSITGKGDTGGIAGKIINTKIQNSAFGSIDDSQVNSVTATGSSALAGGIAGYATDGSVIEKSVSNSNIKITTGNSSAGGIVGYLDESSVNNCLHSGQVNASDEIRMMIGGIAGRMDNSKMSVCYAETLVNAPQNTINTVAGGIAGLIRNSDISYCAAAGLFAAGTSAGRIAGSITQGSVDNVYARQDMLVNYKHVQDDLKNGTGIPHAYMRKSESFYKDKLKMDFRLFWVYPDHYISPRLRWEELPEFIEIHTAEDLSGMRNNMKAFYVLAKDIDLSSYGSWKSVGNSDDPFDGIFDGNGKIINGMRGGSLFGYATNIKIYDLTMLNVNTGNGSVISNFGRGQLERINVTGRINAAYTIGGITASLSNGLMSYCTFNGDVHSDITATHGNSYAGGLAGSVDNSYMFFSSASGIVGTSSMMASYAGGIAGTANNAVISDCYTLNDVYSRGGNRSDAGGAFGALNKSSINNIISYGNVQSIVRNYASASPLVATAGGFAGAVSDTVVRNSITFGDKIESSYNDVLGSGGAESYAARFSGVSVNSAYYQAYSSGSAAIKSDIQSGTDESLIDIAALSESFYNNTLGWNFNLIWKMPGMGDVRLFPIFKRDKDLTTPVAGDEWLWFGVNKYYEEFR